MRALALCAATFVTFAGCTPNFAEKCATLEVGTPAEGLTLGVPGGDGRQESAGPVEDLICCEGFRGGSATPTCGVDCSVAPYSDAIRHSVELPYSPGPNDYPEGVCIVWVSGGTVVGRAWYYN
jgi:hypothetical protein